MVRSHTLWELRGILMQGFVLPAAAGLPSSRVQAQDRSRSPAGVAGLPPSHSLAAVAQHADASVPPGAAVPEDKSWYTGDPTLDYWVLKNIAQPAVRGGLSLIAKEEAKNIIRQCMLRQGSIRHLPGYFQGCIRKAISASEFKQNGGRPVSAPPVDVRSVARPIVRLASPTRAEAFPAPGAATAELSSGVAAEVAASSVSAAALPQSPASALGQAEVASNDSCEAAPWARACLASTTVKSKLLRMFLGHLNPAAVTAISSLVEAAQVNVAIAVCLASTPTASPSDLTLRFAATYKHLTQPAEPLPAVSGAVQSLQLVILHLGSAVGMGHVAMKAAFATVLQRMTSVRLHVLEMHSFVPAELFASVESAATSALGARCQVWSEADGLTRVCHERGVIWAEKQAHLMVLVNWDGLQAALESVSGDSPANAASVSNGISQNIVAFKHAMHRLQTHVPVQRLAVLSFSRAVDAADDVALLNAMFGTSHSLLPELYGVPQHAWSVHSIPQLDKVCGLSETVGTSVTLDGWEWPCDSHTPGCRMPTRVSGELTELIEAQLFGERELDPSEYQLYRLMQMHNKELGLTRLVSRSLLMHMLGLKDLPLAGALEKALPCLRMILRTTGQALPEGACGGHECGSLRWCLNCESLVGMMLSSPNAQLLTDTCASWVEQCLHAWLAA